MDQSIYDNYIARRAEKSQAVDRVKSQLEVLQNAYNKRVEELKDEDERQEKFKDAWTRYHDAQDKIANTEPGTAEWYTLESIIEVAEKQINKAKLGWKKFW